MMLIKGGFNLAFDCTDNTPMILTVHIRPEETSRLIEPEIFTVFPPVETSDYIDSFGNRCTKLVAPPGRLSIWSRFVMGHDGTPEQLPVHAFQHAVQELPEETLMYLLGSRYCDTEKLADLAWALFGEMPAGLAAGAGDPGLHPWAHPVRLSISPAHDRTAFEAHEERRACAAISPIWRSPCAAA